MIRLRRALGTGRQGGDRRKNKVNLGVVVGGKQYYAVGRGENGEILKFSKRRVGEAWTIREGAQTPVGGKGLGFFSKKGLGRGRSLHK